MLQYFINRNYEKGWYLTSSPIITANWQLPSDERWIVPFGGGIGRVFKMGHQPVNIQVQNFYNAIHPKTAAPSVAVSSGFHISFSQGEIGRALIIARAATTP
jgi:hypothetical protein